MKLYLFSKLVQVDGDVKRWIPNANFGNPYNWDLGRPPCGDDIAVIDQESATVFLQMNTTLKELVLYLIHLYKAWLIKMISIQQL